MTPRPPALHAVVLRYLTEVARRGSIRKAALVLNVAASAINRQILKLEDELGVKLFDRHPDGMRLTPAGDLLLRHVGDTLSSYDRLLAEIDGLRGIRSGHVRIAAVDSLLLDFLPGALSDFAQRHPAVTFAVEASAPMAALGELTAGNADLALTFVTAASPTVDLLEAVRMPIGAVMSPRHPLARRKNLTFSDLRGHEVLMQQETLPVVPFLDDEFAAFRASVRPRFTSNSIAMLRHIIRAGLGVAFFTRIGFATEIASGDLVWLPLASPRLAELRLGLFIPAQRTPLPAAAAVARELATRLRALEPLP